MTHKKQTPAPSPRRVVLPLLTGPRIKRAMACAAKFFTLPPDDPDDFKDGGLPDRMVM